MAYENSGLARAFADLWRFMSAEDQEREMAWAIERYESQKKLKALLGEAVACRTKAEKRALLVWWQQTLPEAQVDELIRILKNKDALMKILGWKLIDPRH